MFLYVPISFNNDFFKCLLPPEFLSDCDYRKQVITLFRTNNAITTKRKGEIQRITLYSVFDIYTHKNVIRHWFYGKNLDFLFRYSVLICVFPLSLPFLS